MKPFLLLQLRPEKAAADNEYEAFLAYGGLKPEEAERIAMDEVGVPDLDLDTYSGVIVGGGAPCINDHDKKPEVERFERELTVLLKKIYEKDFPFFGACYGFSFAIDRLGGMLAKYTCYSEDVGAVDITLLDEAANDPLTKGLPSTFRAFVGHKESCMKPPADAVILARSKQCPYHMFRIKDNIYGTQFHPELDVNGMNVRIDIYKGYGYFPIEDAQKLKDKIRDEKITVPMEMLKRFVKRYRKA